MSLLVSVGFTGNAAFHCVCHAGREGRLAFLPVAVRGPGLLCAVRYLPVTGRSGRNGPTWGPHQAHVWFSVPNKYSKFASP